MVEDAQSIRLPIPPVFCDPEQPLTLSALGGTQTLSQVLAYYASRRLDGPALSDGERFWSYAQLDAQVMQIANLIASRVEVTSEAPIALRLPRSALTIMVLLAIGRLGAVYVPLDQDYPQERIDFILQDCGAISCQRRRRPYIFCTHQALRASPKA